MGPCKIQKRENGTLKNTKFQLINSRGVLEAVKGQNSRSWSDPSSDLSSLLFMKGNLLLNEKFFFLRSKVDCWENMTKISPSFPIGISEIYLVVGSGNMTLEFHRSVSSLLFSVPPPLRWHNSKGSRGLISVSTRWKAPRLPPLVITGIDHVQNVSVFEGKTSRRQSVIFAWIVIKQCPLIEKYC